MLLNEAALNERATFCRNVMLLTRPVNNAGPTFADKQSLASSAFKVVGKATIHTWNGQPTFHISALRVNAQIWEGDFVLLNQSCGSFKYDGVKVPLNSRDNGVRNGFNREWDVGHLLA
jgi:hypothetical protein